jgi:cytochrome c peroxidase
MTMRSRLLRLGSQFGVGVIIVGLIVGVGGRLAYPPQAEAQSVKSLPNNFPFVNPNGLAATSSTQGSINFSGEYFQAQGSNGRSCSTCHMPENAWAINPSTISLLFELTAGTHPIFNALDANNPDNDLSTVEARRANYSMMLTRGVFRRGGAPRADREWDVIAVEDPHGFANVNRLVQWRRVMPTINFQLGSANLNWDGGNSVGSDQLAGLVRQATGNVTGGQQGQPAPAEVITEIVNFESSLSTAQSVAVSVGTLHAAGARGGPEALSQMTKTQGRFDLFDAWIDSPVPGRRQIARGQELFNNVNAGSRSCNACHNSANNGTNINNTLFDTQTASAEARTPDLPLYTLRNRATGEERQLTDTGAGNVTGLWKDLGRFKTPTLRALSARAPYFHNGSAATLEDVVRHYERFLGFVFTDKEREDLVAFLKAL